MRSSQSLVEHVRWETSTTIYPSSAFTREKSNPETTEASTVFHSSTTDSAKITSVPPNPWAPKFLLTLDGGGIRGYSTLLIIRELMEAIAQIEQQYIIPATSSAAPLSLSVEQEEAANHESTRMAGLSQIMPTTNSPSKKPSKTGDISSRFLPCHYFDYIGGTSTGGEDRKLALIASRLIAIMLARLRMTISECIDEYEHLGATVFWRPQFFARNLQPLIPRVIWSPAERNSDRLRRYLKGIVERRLFKISPGSEEPDSFESNSDLCRTIVVALRENGVSQAPHLFRSYNNYKRAPQCAIWEAARATSAAPSYFKPIKINESRYLDGGIGANNPSVLVLHEVMEMHPELRNPIGLLLSIGTGTRSRPSSSSLSSLKSIISTQTEDTHKRILKKKTDINFCYKRFDADGLGDIKHDSWKPKHSGTATIQCIADYTKHYLEGENVQGDLRECAWKLVESRRRRAETPDWESFAYGVRQV
ncbi:hypothetical protein MMC31_002998 [Peltigera leucophlebia]|nr:hypothetical protein [Peltigera leucophlebia]